MRLKTFTPLAFALFIFILQACHAQSKFIKKNYAYAKEMTYGKEMKDLEGKTVTRSAFTYFIFIETSGHGQLLVDDVSADGQAFTPNVLPVEQQTVLIGQNLADQKQVKLTVPAGRKLWKIELSAPVQEQNPTFNKFLINGSFNGSSFKIKTSKVVILSGDIVG